ncbi:extracellular solute-binding protein [Paenibacillus sp. TRM 82003]|uniref:extracellular solute-binding protein n=1 Tax=Kineococcus sp. TRM81007 TaxID=2925831 RepID=UPI001F57C7C1|nr:extracellular solute-binding protein [Kineococcus sp. TRM81007]MCI2240682.1 extracellular solute-binding protein [Kineococcus sp. TRM81007]MCI3925396.1 extracellular solute-binding protein [Paenibacillus sp. TRM 82003]
MDDQDGATGTTGAGASGGGAPRTAPARLPRARHEHLLRQVGLHGSVRSARAAAELGVSEVTIRRDIVELERAGLLARVHGGAIALASAGAPQAARLLVGVVVPGTAVHFPDVVRGMESISHAQHARLVLGVSHYRPEVEEKQVARLLALGVDGLLLAPTPRGRGEEEIASWITSIPVPTVLLERRFGSMALRGFDSVRTDHAHGAALAVDHLVALGHRRVAIAVYDKTPTAPSVRDGHREAGREALRTLVERVGETGPRGPARHVELLPTLTTVVNTDLLGELGVPVPDADTTWDEYDRFLADVAAAGASRTPQVHGSNDYTHVMWLFQIWLGQQGKTMFEDGGLGFTEADLTEWWGRAPALYENGAFLPPQRVQQIEGADAIGLGETAAEISWDNFLVRFSEGSGGAAMTLLPPPADDPEERGMFLKPSLMLAMGSNTNHPDEAAALIDFITNDPQVGAVFGMSRGVPASATALEGFEPTGLDQQILAYEESLEPYLTSSPPPPVAGFGSLETAFTRIGQDLSHGSITVDQAVEQWFTEAESALQR